MHEIYELGYFGNVWIRQNHLEKEGDFYKGHEHKFDHVTLLSKGSVRVEVEGKPPKVFVAPTFIIMRKELQHKMVSVEDDTVYYCIFALRDIDGEVVGDIYGPQHDPLSHSGVEDGYWEKQKKLDI